MSNRTTMARIYYIHQEVRAGHYPKVPYLARQLEVSERTLRRDIEFMRDRLGAPLEYDWKRRGYYYAQGFELPPLALSKDELEAIWVAHLWLQQTRGTPYEQAMRRAWNKIATSFGLDDRLLEERAVISVVGAPVSNETETVDKIHRQLQEAAHQNRVVRITYYSPAKDVVTVRDIEPINFCLTSDGCYCIAFCRLRNEMRTFHLGRIQSLQATRDKFLAHVDFCPEAYFAGSLGVMRGEPVEIHLRVTHEQARYLDEQPRHHSQRLLRTEPGGVVYRFELADNLETLRWILSLGAAATVLCPASFREKVERELENSLANYRLL
ncbi:MAG: helix-turn-helix transcriptional regulator [Bacillota bacterium]